jgi:hypothetical protein
MNVRREKIDSANFFVFDNTLRYLYITLRNRGAGLLAIEFSHRGKIWRADTPEEAIRLRQQLDVEDLRESTDPEADAWLLSEWTPEVFANFLLAIGEQQKAAVLIMAEHAGISSAELAKRLKLDNEMALAGVISGLSKQLKTLDLSPDDLYTVKTTWNGKRKERFFFLRDNFRQAAEEAEWPEVKGGKDATSTKRTRK